MTQSLNLGPKENKLLLALAEKGVSVFTFEEAQEILQTTNSSVKHILMDLARKRRLQRIEKGKYLLIPEKAGQELYWSETPWVIVPYLIDEYYVGFWTAMNYWDMTEQIPYTIFVATTKRKRDLKFGNQKFEFITLSKKKFFGFIKQKSGKADFNVSSKEKTIVDGLMHPEYCGGIPEVTKAMWNVREELNWEAVLEMSKQVGLNIVSRRLGYLLNVLEIKQDIARELRKEPFKGFHFLDPNADRKRLDYAKECGLIINRTKNELLGWKGY